MGRWLAGWVSNLCVRASVFERHAWMSLVVSTIVHVVFGTQYERRFVELYSLVAEKLKETRKYFALYNTLDDTRTYIASEVSLLDSIQKGYTKSMASPAGKEQLLSQFKAMIDGVNKTVEKVTGDAEAEKAALDARTNSYNRLLDQQRTYFKTVKLFQEECVKNEQLMAMMQEAQAEQEEAERQPEGEE